VTATIFAADVKLEIKRSLPSRPSLAPPKSIVPSPSSFWPLELIQSRDGCMTTRMIICCTSLDCSELGKSSFEGGGAQRTNEGHGVALWLRPGVRGDDGPLEVILAESIAGEKLVDVGSVFEMTEHYRPTGPHWYLSLIDVEVLHRNRGCGATLLQHGLRKCDGSIARYISGPRTRKILPLSQAWLRDHGYDPGRLVAFHFSDAASAALKGNAKRRHRCLHVGQWQATVVTIDIKTAIQPQPARV
jgi:hypothetical protein